MKRFLGYVWKLPLASAAFMIGLTVSGMLLPLLGLEAPALPDGVDAETIGLAFALGSLLFGLALALLARGLCGSFTVRWLSLSLMMWVAYAINNVVEGAIYSTFSATSGASSMLYTALSLLLPAMGQAAVVAALFKLPAKESRARLRLSTWSPSGWAWRLAIALIAFPVIYFVFGVMVEPIVGAYYEQGQFELALPPLWVIIPVQLLRSAGFCLVSLPPILLWGRGRTALILSLGLALFVFVGGFSMATTYWFPWQLRVVHSLEILVDEMLYALVLGLLFVRPEGGESTG
ncbi:MAG: hypothetical protein JXA09_09530 [Anaerolineae bacterium]|nr:hypothetical protein [Anaerolineae bacterium]